MGARTSPAPTRGIADPPNAAGPGSPRPPAAGDRALTHHRPSLHRERASVGIGRQLAAAADERCVQRRAAQQRMRGARDEAPLQCVQLGQDAPHHQDRVHAVVGATSMGRDARGLHLDPLEPPVTDADRRGPSASGDDGRVRLPVPGRGVRADACVLLVRDDGATITRPTRPPGEDASRRAAPRIEATPPFMSCAPRPKSLPSRTTGSKGAAIPSTPTVSLCPQSIREGPARPLSIRPKTLGRPGAASAIWTSMRDARNSAARRSAIAPSPAPPGTSEG